MSNTYRVQNPATDEIVETFDSATDAEVEGVLAKAAAAYREWSARPMSERAEIVARAASLFAERKEELAKIAAEAVSYTHL